MRGEHSYHVGEKTNESDAQNVKEVERTVDD